MAVAIKEPAVTTPNTLAAARRKAVDLCAAAYSPQPVAQPDGSTLLLCWNGRIARGYEKLAEARAAKQTALVQAIQETIRGLERQYAAAYNAAEEAASALPGAASGGRDDEHHHEEHRDDADQPAHAASVHQG